MRIAFDVDGVISEAPEFFATLTQALCAAGHQVYIITDHDAYYRTQRETELRQWGIAYDKLVIAGQKEGVCHRHGIHFALDDAALEYFPNSRIIQLGLVELDGSAEPSTETPVPS